MAARTLPGDQLSQNIRLCLLYETASEDRLQSRIELAARQLPQQRACETWLAVPPRLPRQMRLILATSIQKVI
jgi:hypothetical protein